MGMFRPVRLPSLRLGRYELITEISRGGMGAVYLARTAVGEFQRMFALKILHPHLAEDVEFVNMLFDEARLAGRIHHPNAVSVVDTGIDAGCHYLVMDYIDGCTLRHLFHLDSSRPPSLIIAAMIDALNGLHAAHTLCDDDGEPLHIVHRDVSPDNILLGVDGIARIADFGIAKAESRITSTRPGVQKGKYSYMSPEQVSGAPLDHRSDVFAAGVVLFNSLTGVNLFGHENPATTFQRILQRPVPPASKIGHRPPAAFDGICFRALQRDPGARYPSTAEMAEDLRRVALHEGVLASPREVSEWVKRCYGDSLAERRASIRQFSSIAAMSRVERLPLVSAAQGPAASALDDDMPLVTVEIEAEAAAATVAPPVPETIAVVIAAPPARRRGWRSPRAIATAALGCAVALSLAVLLRTPAPAARAATGAAAAIPAPPSAAPLVSPAPPPVSPAPPISPTPPPAPAPAAEDADIEIELPAEDVRVEARSEPGDRKRPRGAAANRPPASRKRGRKPPAGRESVDTVRAGDMKLRSTISPEIEPSPYRLSQ